jgi:hypothetical protein
MKFGSEGYDLGLRVPDWWWQQAKPSCAAPMKEEKDYTTGTVELVLATISALEFDLYWEPVVWSSTFFNKTANQIRSRRDKQRQKFGWIAIPAEEVPGLSVNRPDSIKHKYFSVEHRGI